MPHLNAIAAPRRSGFGLDRGEAGTHPRIIRRAPPGVANTVSSQNKPPGPRVVRRASSSLAGATSWRELSPSKVWRAVCSYLGLERRGREERVEDHSSLVRFIETRASMVAQTSLYGYLRTRAGMRYPELFEDDPFVAAINIAKWHIWLDCVSDLAVFAGSRIAGEVPREAPEVAELMKRIVADVIEGAGALPEAGEDFDDHADRVRQRIARCDWLAVGDDEAAFSDSPASLVRYAPIVDELKQLDEEIVRNSVRFRWQEVRRDLKRNLDAAAVLG